MTYSSVVPLAQHLWESTWFVAAVWLLTLLLRKEAARFRYWLWLAASVKFLIPFALLVNTGRHIPVAAAPAAVLRSLPRVAESAAPMTAAVLPAPAQPALPPFLLPGIWLCGFLIAGSSWSRKWRDLRRAVRAATPVTSHLSIGVRLSDSRMEPGVAGIWRQVLLLPRGIADRLTPAQFAAVLTHELSHARRRDNLAMAVHALVETLFWFHPLVWWIRHRLVEERERACDEDVVGRGAAPEVYAEGILSVCRFYVEAPETCASGVTGADLKKRLQEIMTHRIARKLTWTKRLLLASAAMLSVAAPLTIGMLHSPSLRAQSAAAAKFEVASVKRNNSTDARGMSFQTQPGGRLVVTGVPLYILIEWSYGLDIQSVRMSGAPEWSRSERYDIDARAAARAIPADLTARERENRMRPMLRSLLADRFHLVVRAEQKELPVYALTVAKGGVKMEKSDVQEKDCGPDVPCHGFMGGQGRGVHGKAASIADLIGFVENWSDRPMVDRTGLSGLFNMNTDGWVPMRGPGGGSEGLDEPTRPTLFTVFERQLGLKAEPERARVEVYVVERVDRPTEN
ncbi:MAG TPA: M56 family metallopeptidase [Candidatus Sulfopaludibacter sp.]|jgi:uncharacterized protein (TIGR03435 family)|nr:M56 family metallopeptidase [Candidatus Sulfopaludibacter sp.]